MLRFSGRYLGIHASDGWFCSSDCLERFLHHKIVTEITSRPVQDAPHLRRMPLGLLLVSRGALSADQLALVLEKQKSDGTNLGEAAQQLGFVTAEQVTAAVAAQWSCPTFPLAGRSLSLPEHLPVRLIELFEMLPVHFVEGEKRLMIGFVSRVHYQVLSTIESVTQCHTVPCFITAPDYRHGLQILPPSNSDNELIFDRPTLPSEIARLSRNYVHQLNGREARYGMCEDYFWIRIWGTRHQTDLIFRVQQD